MKTLHKKINIGSSKSIKNQKSKIKNWLIILYFLSYCSFISAQSKHEFIIDGGFGLSSLQFSTEATGKPQIRLGLHGGLGYNFFFFDRWNIGTGIGLMQYNSSFNADVLSSQYTATDRQGSDFEFRSKVNDYREKQGILQLQIPVMLQFQTSDIQRFYAAAGVKVGIPVMGKYSNTSENITNSGYYYEENYEYKTQKFMGFGTFDAVTNSGKLDLKIAYTLSVELGMKIILGRTLKVKFAERKAIYAGIFIDYGLNNIVRIEKTESQPQFIEYKPDLYDYTINSVVGSKNENNLFAEKIFPIGIGIKLRYALGRGSSLPIGEYPLFRRWQFHR